jgi:hypothetical protein
MKNYFKVILSITMLVGLSFSAHAQDVITQKQSKFVSKFVGAVNVQKKNKVYKMITKEYKSKIKGSKEVVLSNLFAGRVKKTGEFSKVPFYDISSMRLLEVRELQEGITLYTFILATTEGTVDTSLILMKKGKKNKFSFQPYQN